MLTVELDRSGIYWNVTDVCSCCGKQVQWTTNEAGAKNIEWIKSITPIHCCEKHEPQEWSIVL